MQRNVLEYLENTVQRLPSKIAYSNGTDSVSFAEVYDNARRIGSFLSENGYKKEPIAIFMQKHPKSIISFFGVVYSGCYYVPLDEEMPSFRIELILKNLKPRAIICDDKTVEKAKEFGGDANIYKYEEVISAQIDEDALLKVREKQIDTDPLYVVFTSGSTGVPKGVIACHRSVIDYIEQLSSCLGFNEDTIFGNQTPLYFDACLKELYPTLKFGATTYLIPKMLFMFPVKLVEFLNTYKINTVCWVVSALTIISGFKTLEKVKPEYLHTIAFGSEVFPLNQFKLWREALPNAKFTNLYGPTEATGMSCFYHVDRDFAEGESIPIGRPFPNTDLLLLNGEEEAKPGESGEICLRGTCLTLGYYNMPEKTAECFVQNPLNKNYPELIYKTGDLAKYNEKGELIFIGRKDFQIKHMGHRIELPEIEAVCGINPDVAQSCALYNKEKEQIVLFYTGDVDEKALVAFLKEKLPRYMVPNRTERLESMPFTANGKIDRKGLAGRL